MLNPAMPFKPSRSRSIIPLLLLYQNDFLAWGRAPKCLGYILKATPQNPRRFGPKGSIQKYSAVAEHIPDESSLMHVVDGVICREVSVELPFIGTVTVLEATAESQESLVEMALALDENELEGDQKLAAGDPYGAVLWPAAWAVANFLLENGALFRHEPKIENESGHQPLQGISIVELGTGTGLVSVAASLGGAAVLATDYEPLALTLAKYASGTFHVDAEPINTRVFDICNEKTPLPKADVVVAADIMYEPKTGIAMARRAAEALRQGSHVVVGDSPGRPGRPAFLRTLRELGLPSNVDFVNTVGKTCSGPRHELICGKGSTSVSATPRELLVAVMHLDPSMLKM